jgi:NAD(P)-dependent dehydrogenase (short-subunit alcohol dehydrogenase family)
MREENTMDGQFTGKVALVTGGSSGIGRAASLAFAQAGARVVIADVDSAGGEESARRIAGANGEAIFVRADVSRAAEVEALVARTVETYGRLDCALNNAGIVGSGPSLHEYPGDLWAQVLAVNLTSVFLCMKHEIAQMLHQGQGVIVNMASVAGLRGTRPIAGNAAYNASKHGVVGLTRVAALEYAAEGIRVNALCPAFVRTPLVVGDVPDPELEVELGAVYPLGRLGTPEEVAAAVLWLCSDAAAFITGLAMPIDGGYTAR